MRGGKRSETKGKTMPCKAIKKVRYGEKRETVFDVETTGNKGGLEPYRGSRIFSYCIGHLSGAMAGRVEVWRLDGKGANDPKEGWKRLKEYFANTDLIKIAHNFKFELSMLFCEDSVNHGLVVPKETVWHDTMLLAQCWRGNELKYSLDYLTWKYGRYECPEDDIVNQQSKERGEWGDVVNGKRTVIPMFDRVDLDVMHRYQVADGERTMLLWEMYAPEMQKFPVRWNDYLNEIELAKVTQRMEARGILLHRHNIDKMKTKLTADRAQTEADITQWTDGQPLNMNSGDQVAELLYNKLNYPITKLTKKGKKPSVDKDVLMEFREKMPHPAIDTIMKCRAWTKGLGALAGYERAVDAGGLVHPSIKTNHAGTGREACENPNLQNVAKDASLKTVFPVPLRSCFRAEVGEFLLFVDYAQIELRLIIDAAGEPELIQVIKDGGDSHHLTVECFLTPAIANKLLKEDKAQYKVMRGAFKNVGFGVGYGAGDEKIAVTLARRLDESPMPGAPTVGQGCKIYRQRFPKISTFASMMIKTVKKTGLITTAFGRELNLPASEAHAGSNYLIQGTAAGILKRAQVRVQKHLDEKWTGLAQMRLPIHDELLFSVSRNALPRLKQLTGEIREIMIDMPEIKVPLDVEWKYTTTVWNKAKTLEFK
jgi:DNA polymerase I-like protein with 3'-5' exonuclease and polymerase domains